VIPAAGSSVLNPLDIGMASLSDKVFTTLISVLKEDPLIHGLIFVQSADAIRHILGSKGLEQIATLTAQVKKELGKPVYPVLEVINPGDATLQGTDFSDRYHENNIAIFPSFEMAAKVIKNLYEYQCFLVKRNQGEPA
jgi:hypothetical protein